MALSTNSRRASAAQVAERLTDLHRIVGRVGDRGDLRAGTARCTSATPTTPVFLALAEHVRARHPDDRPTCFSYWDDVGNPTKLQELLASAGVH